MITINGVPKPSYRALQLLNLPSVANQTLAAKAVSCGPEWPEELFVLAKPSGKGGGVLYLANFGIRDAPMQTLTVQVNLTRGTMYRIDDSLVNPARVWQTLGSPVPPAGGNLSALMGASMTNVSPVTGPTATVQIPPYGVVVLDIEQDAPTVVKTTTLV
jgi:hypothetical protein